MELNEDRIKEEAKQILDKFAKALDKVDSGKFEEGVDREEYEREEGKGEKSEEGFKKRMLENSPKKDEDFIIAEKGEWK